jgi:predicted methyltransferase
MSLPPVLSHYQTRPLQEARDAGRETTPLSLDLGRSTATARLTEQFVQLPDGQRLTWVQIETINAAELACFTIENDAPHKVQFFSEQLNRYYSLMPTEKAPTMLISGIPMHRIKGTNPWRDTESKIKAAAPVVGTVLDTTMGLGYTALMAARTADEVLTIELDPTVEEVCRRNPWSGELFTNPKISRRIGDAAEVVVGLGDGRFHRIIHDPPMFSLAGHLYATAFYRELHRLLKPKGRLFHYIGNPKSKSGAGVTRGVVRRLQEAGFRRVRGRPGAFGVVASK